MKTIGRDFGDVARKVYATASGTLPNGKPVVVNADGTVSVITETSATQALGSAVVFESASTTYVSGTFDSANNRVVFCYRDGGNSGYGTAVVGTVSGTSISFGTPVVFNSGGVYYTGATFDSNANKVVIVYRNAGNSNYGTAIVGTVSNTAISFGTAAVFASVTTNHAGATFDSDSNKVVIAYNNNNQYGTAVVATVSGTNISFGTPVVYKSAYAAGGNDGSLRPTFDSNSNKVVIAFSDASNGNDGYAVVGTVSGTAISFGSLATWGVESAFVSAVFDSNANKVVIVYQDADNSGYGSSRVATVSGTTISFGSATVFNAGNTFYVSSVFDSNANKVVITFYDAGNSNYSTLIAGTVSGTGISFGSEVVFDQGTSASFAPVFDSTSNKVAIGYSDGNNNAYGTGIVFQNSFSSTNLTAENYIGMSSGGVEYDEGPATIGSAVVFENATVPAKSSTFDSNSNKVVIVYRDGGNSNYGTAVVGTVNGTSISFGSVVVFESAAVNYVSCTFDSNSNKVVISYTDDGNSGYGTAIVGTVSGTNISFGTAVVFRSAGAGSTNATFDSNSNKVVICYAGDSDHGTAIVGTVSGTGISFGTAVVYESANSVLSVATFDSNSNKVVIAYNDYPNGQYGTAIVGTVSGTNISFGTAVVFENASIGTTGHTITFDSNSNKVVIAYQDIGNSSYGTAIVGTVSGTGISFGTAVVFENATSTYPAATFDSNSNKVVIAYRDGGNSNKGTVIAGAVSGTSISFESPTVFESGASLWITTVFDSNSNTSVISYRDDGNSGYGTSIVFKNAFDNTVRGQVASGGAALVNTKGAININQNALTAGQSYFVQPDGTIGTTAGDPSVFAGTAVSATKLIVKG